MRKTLSTSLAVLFSAGALLAAACGDNNKPGGDDDIGDDDGDDDTTPPDAGPDANTGPTVAATLAVTDVHLTDPAAQIGPGVFWNGGAISISFNDLTMNGGEVVFGTSPIGGCVITKYDATHTPNPELDVGVATITNSPSDEATPTGLLKTVGPCAFQEGIGYACASGAGAGRNITATDLPNGTPPSPPATWPPGAISYTFTNADTIAAIKDQKLVGSWLAVSGFTNTNFNSSAARPAFPIIAQSNTQVGPDVVAVNLVVINPSGEGQTAESATAAGFTLLNAVAPVPSTQADFLGTGSINVVTAGSDAWPAINETIDVPGQGFALDADSDTPEAFPTATAADVSYQCDGADENSPDDDTCGDGTTTTLTALILSGSATKKDLTGLLPFQMPTEVPGTDEWLEWQCGFLLSKNATMPQAAVQEILDFAPTRVEMRVLYVAGKILGDSQEVKVLAGHGVVGHTTFPPPAAN